MTDRERTLAVLNYENYDRLSVIHFASPDYYAAKPIIDKTMFSHSIGEYIAREELILIPAISVGEVETLDKHEAPIGTPAI